MLAKIELYKYSNDLYMVVIDNGFGNKLFMTDKVSYDEAVQWIEQFTASTFEIVER